MKKSILHTTGVVVAAALFCVLYVTCNDSGANSGKQDDRADAFVSKFNRKPSGGGDGGYGGGGHVHDWGDWVVTTPATCDAAGLRTRTCTIDNSHTDTEVIPKLTGVACEPTVHTHVWGDWVVTTPATCDAAGVETRTCKIDNSHKETRAIAMLTGTACNSGGGNGSYESVTIGGKTWMKKNLNIETENSKCYNNSPDSCAKYGRLYTWDAAKTACPSGWHLPTRAEWGALAVAAGGTGNYGAMGGTAGKALKSKTGWNSYSGITNEDTYGFSALPGGSYYGSSFNYVGVNGLWWTATESSSGYAYDRDMHYGNDNVYGYYDDEGYGFSVRCVADD